MSNNKTVIPGLEGNTQTPQPGVQGASPVYGQYDGRTVIPGVNMGVQSANPSQQVSSKPIVGFLYSVSRTGNGEFWPLHVGANYIGRSASLDVYLPEATVSEQHAVIVAHLDKNPEKVSAYVEDTRSTCGTMINGESLGIERRACVNGDIITIGEHYDLYLTLIDVKQLGLKVCKEFIPTDAQQAYDPSGTHVLQGGGGQYYHGQQPFPPSNTQVYNGPAPTQTMPQGPPPVYQPGRTVGVDEASTPRTEPGRTIFM